MSINRKKCAICYNKLRFIYSVDEIPITLSCVELEDHECSYDKMSYSICVSCNTIQLDKLIPLGQLYKFSHNVTSVGKTWENYFNLFIKTIQYIIQNKTILEIGCPSGKIANKCSQYNKWYIVDPNKNKSIMFNDNIVFIESFFDENFKLNEKVDIIIHSHLFEHIYSPNEFLQHCNKLLNDNGEMIFGVPNMEHMIDTTLFSGMFFEHTLFLNKENITFLLNKNGFEIVNIFDYENHSTIYHTKKMEDKNKKTADEFNIKDYSNSFLQVIDETKLFIERCNLVISKNIDKDIYIFGASYNTQYLLFFGLNNNIRGIIDNCKEKTNKYFYGTKLKIFCPDVLNDNSIVILKNGYYSNEISLQIKQINTNIIII